MNVEAVPILFCSTVAHVQEALMAEAANQDYPTILGPDASFKGELTFDKATPVAWPIGRPHHHVRPVAHRQRGEDTEADVESRVRSSLKAT